MKLSDLFLVFWIETVLGLSLHFHKEEGVKLLEKRASKTTTLVKEVWTTTTGTKHTIITPFALDGVTVSASPIDAETTPWVSLDSSGVPYEVTPTVKDAKTLSSSPTPTNTNFPTPLAAPPVLRCMGDRVTDGNPFCIGEGAEFVVNETYWITWDPLYFNPDNDSNGISKVKIKVRSFPNNESISPIETSDWVENKDGFYPWTIESSDIDSDMDGYAQIYLSPFRTSDTDSEEEDTAIGPVVRLIASKSDAYTKISRVPSDNNDDDSSDNKNDKGSSNKAKIIVPAVVVPVVVIFLIAGAVFYYLLKKRKNAVKKSSNSIKLGVLCKNKGYVGSRSQRMGESELAETKSQDSSYSNNVDGKSEQNPFKG
ncbi:unnamed protein product [Debaryomyces tyrocola]|nr:unnamed protein product [Debaryomyces tyrocola]